MKTASCVHRPTGGVPAQLLWDDDANVDGERIGICVCLRCGEVFAGLFADRTAPTPKEGNLRYTGPFMGRPQPKEAS